MEANINNGWVCFPGPHHPYQVHMYLFRDSLSLHVLQIINYFHFHTKLLRFVRNRFRIGPITYKNMMCLILIVELHNTIVSKISKINKSNCMSLCLLIKLYDYIKRGQKGFRCPSMSRKNHQRHK